MRYAIAILLCLLALTAAGQTTPSLQGQWNVEVPSRPDVAATLLIDGQRRVTWDSAQTKALGYVKEVTATHATILLTDRDDVGRIQCSVVSSDLMICHNFLASGGVSAQLKLKRVGPGPARITQAPR